MCSSKSKLHGRNATVTPAISHINGRPVLQPAGNRVPLLERRDSLKKTALKIPPPPTQHLPSPPTSTTTTTNATQTKFSPSPTPPISPNLKSPRPPATKRGGDTNGLNSSAVLTPRSATKSAALVKKLKNNGGDNDGESTNASSLKYSSSSIVEAPGSIAAARREQVAIMQVQRKMRIAHYGRTKSGKFEGKVVLVDALPTVVREEKKCNFITSSSDPISVAYHDEEWGVPVHDDKLLFELLVLTGAQVGSDWTTVLKKRQEFREAFSGFDAETVSKFTEKNITSTSADYGIELSQVRGVVDNAHRILEIEKLFGSFDKYLWGFVNHKPIATRYKSCYKIPVKTSKSEAISKDMVRRGFRFVGPIVVHSFMQAAGLTNDHLTTCRRHLQCAAAAVASQAPTPAPAL